MILRRTILEECWCPHCGHGQMKDLHEDLFRNSKHLAVGDIITCGNCGKANTVEDIITIIPTGYMISSANDRNKVKSNNDLMKFLESDEQK